MQAVVLAGGLATRMHPRTLTVPKAMLEVAGRPFIDWQLEKLAACGFDDVVLCVAFLAEQIEAHVGDGATLCGGRLRVRYSHEGEKLLGTAGALRAAGALLAPTFLITYGDSYLPFDYAEPVRVLDANADCDGVMSIFANHGQWDGSNAEPDESGAWVRRYVKNRPDLQFTHIDYGALALRREVITALPLGEPRDLAGIQTDLAASKRLRAVVARDRFFEIGSPEGLATLDRWLTLNESSSGTRAASDAPAAPVAQTPDIANPTEPRERP